MKKYRLLLAAGWLCLVGLFCWDAICRPAARAGEPAGPALYQEAAAGPATDQEAADGAALNQEAAAGQDGSKLSDQMAGLDLDKVEEHLAEINRDLKTYLPELNLREMMSKMVRGELGLSLGEVTKGLLAYFFREMVANSRLLGRLLILAVLCAVLQNIQSAFEQGTIAKIAWSVCFLVLLTLALGSFTIAIQTGRQAIEEMVSFMNAMLPVLITLLTAMGNINSAAIFHPLTLVVLNAVSALVQNVVFPLIFFAVILGLANNITARIDVSRLAGLLRQLSLGLLGLSFAGFLGFMMAQGIAGSVADGVAIRTAKFGVGVFVPVVGKLFSEALEAVMGTSLLLKNAIGLVGILAVFFICAFPVLKIVALMFIYKIGASMIEPIGDKLIADSLNIMGSSLTTVFVAVAAVGIMFFFMIALVVGAGDYSLMLR